MKKTQPKKLSEPTWLPNRKVLAEKLGCHPQTVARWCSEHRGDPGLPVRRDGRWNLPGWRKFIESHGLLVSKNNPDDAAAVTLTELRRQHLAARLRREERADLKESGNIFTLQEVTDWLAAKGAHLTAVLHQRFSSEYPDKLAGLSAIEIAVRLAAFEKELLELIAEPIPQASPA